jgi:hypothetical protein
MPASSLGEGPGAAGRRRDTDAAFAGPEGDRAAIVANNDLVSEVGW